MIDYISHPEEGYSFGLEYPYMYKKDKLTGQYLVYNKITLKVIIKINKNIPEFRQEDIATKTTARLNNLEMGLDDSTKYLIDETT